jgi:hypothetical protein
MSEPISLRSEEELVRYIRDFKKKYGISNTDIAEILGTLNHPIDRSIVSKMLKDDFEEGYKAIRPISYTEAYQIIKFLIERTSPFPESSIETIYTPSNRVEEEGTIFFEDTIEKAALMMFEKDFSQLIVKDSKTKKCLGFVVDYSIFREMLSPFEISKEWLTTLKKKRISSLIDRPPIYNTKSKLIEVAQGLIHHYSALVQEDNGENGIITRWDFLKLIKGQSE